MRWLDDLVEKAHVNLKGERELEAAWSRGLSDEQIVEFKVGYLDGPISGIAYPKEFLEWSRPGQKLVDVFVFPLTNALGQVKGVQFRHVKRDVKGYTDYFISKDEPAYFGLAQAMPYVWETRRICLVEGVFDLFPVQRVFPYSVTTMTSSVTTTFYRFLLRNVKEVWFGYDSDGAGRKGVLEFREKYGSTFERIRSPQLPRLKMSNGKLTKDPSELWEVLGSEKLGVYLKTAFEQ